MVIRKRGLGISLVCLAASLFLTAGTKHRLVTRHSPGQGDFDNIDQRVRDLNVATHDDIVRNLQLNKNQLPADAREDCDFGILKMANHALNNVSEILPQFDNYKALMEEITHATPNLMVSQDERKNAREKDGERILPVAVVNVTASFVTHASNKFNYAGGSLSNDDMVKLKATAMKDAFKDVFSSEEAALIPDSVYQKMVENCP